jgi:hypothetical protein
MARATLGGLILASRFSGQAIGDGDRCRRIA